ncbi:MAG: 2-phospho-L-lactate transferase CofD family protein, partial [Blastocatellia bacterium]
MLFSGGRGSRVLSKQLINHPRVELTLAVNGYDDGASTGEVRRFLGDSLGPSDFRKNASRLAREMQSCRPELVELLDLRFPLGYSTGEALAAFRIISGQMTDATLTATPTGFQTTLLSLLAKVDEPARLLLAGKLRSFEQELGRAGRDFSFSDCSLGNLAFAGCFLEVGRDFNAAITDYCAMLDLPDGLIENVTDGMNACLVALDRDHRLLASEADIVDANRRNHIKDIYLIDRPLTGEEERWLASVSNAEVTEFLQRRAKLPAANPRLLERIAEADLIIYSPGTQHSSLFPSYLTPGLGAAIAQNLTAIKLLITNLQEDAEIPNASAVDIIEKATYYLKGRGAQPISTPCLITHYLINDHRQTSDGYVPPGRLESLEDPRLVRIGDYEEGVTGRHDAAKVLTPFIETILQRGARQRIAVWLLETSSLNKISQTILEMLRGGIGDLPLSVSVFYHSRESFAPEFTRLLPFAVENVA